jgi:hypothetical protein
MLMRPLVSAWGFWSPETLPTMLAIEERPQLPAPYWTRQVEVRHNQC